ncbi:MAG: protein phosphatase 2C domain-containing protein [Propionibacteriaceae bacterium]|jgi:protein phosphatase|nr:protein phosphatase 2C domain-containing protein [Propionibacteriaceae bacterium]
MICDLISIDVAAVTSAGRKRRINEDTVVNRCPVFMVADGMGGHEAGELASAIVAEEMDQLVEAGRFTVNDVKLTLTRARERIGLIESHDARARAGTTVSGVVALEQSGEPYWLVVNLGDSRTYRLRDEALEQLSIDHSEVQELLDAGRITQEQARHHPRRNVVTRVLGSGTLEQPDYWLVPVEPHDRLLICSDGLTTEVTDADIERILLRPGGPSPAVEALLEAALSAGGRDNISVIVVDARLVADAAAGPTVEEFDHSDQGDDTVPVAQLRGGL